MANNIRYVCLSDLHLGEEDSLLTNLKPDSTTTDPRYPSLVMKRLIDCIRHLIENANYGRKPILVLAGDVLELALATVNQAAMVFERFIELTLQPDEALFSGIIYLPGNHDHHFWESARETQYAKHIGKLRPGKHLPIPWHVTRMFEKNPSKLPQAYLLTTLIQRHAHLGKNGIEINAAYPNYGILSRDEQKCVIFHHGHFIDSLYTLMSFLKTLVFPKREMPKYTWDIEAENFAWIDFFWSTMGRSGEFGQDVELIYEKMRDEAEFKKLLSGLAKNLKDKYDLPGPDWAAAKLIEKILHAAADKAFETERKMKDKPLSKNGREGLKKYMRGPLKEQILRERSGNMPIDVTFVFGHTHKPFQKDMNFQGYPQWVNVYNTGGWVVDTVKPEPLHGASMILIDEKLNATSIRMYDQKEDAAASSVKVLEARHKTEPSNPFHLKIQDLVHPSENPWKTFSETVAQESKIRYKNLKERISSG
ncbi:MAG: hypothetical protein GTO29_13305 [Candidatus Latescibacteria bacterium]|nr:hypothetical protein [Candidatus Latescibacterota bacterium]NIO57228.1 hypothetical protein [Candidatus Latescibacterota bacterium]